MERILSRERENIEKNETDKFKIGILGLSPGAGATLITLCLAQLIAGNKINDVAVVEISGNSIYDSVGMDKHFAGRDFFQFYQNVFSGNSIRGKKNIDEGINWIIKHPKEAKIYLDIGHKFRLINNALGNIILCDFSGETYLSIFASKERDEKWQTIKRILEDMDHLIFVIDPMPSKMMGRTELFLEIMELSLKRQISFVVNKYNTGVNVKEMKDFLKIKNLVLLPLLDSRSLYSAEYNCKMPFSQREVKNQMGEPLKTLLNSIKSECL